MVLCSTGRSFTRFVLIRVAAFYCEQLIIIRRNLLETGVGRMKTLSPFIPVLYVLYANHRLPLCASMCVLQVSETGLNILHSMLMNMSNVQSDERQVFFKTFFMDILQHMFAVITDRSQTGSKHSLFCVWVGDGGSSARPTLVAFFGTRVTSPPKYCYVCD